MRNSVSSCGMILAHYVGWYASAVAVLIVVANCEWKNFWYPYWRDLRWGYCCAICAYSAFPIWFGIGYLLTDCQILSVLQEAVLPELHLPVLLALNNFQYFLLYWWKNWSNIFIRNETWIESTYWNFIEFPLTKFLTDKSTVLKLDQC